MNPDRRCVEVLRVMKYTLVSSVIQVCERIINPDKRWGGGGVFKYILFLFSDPGL